MGCSNGLLEQSEKSGKGAPGLPGIAFLLTSDGNFDINDKWWTYVADPVNNKEAATKSYVDNHLGRRPSSDVSKAYVDSENAKQDIAINDKASKCDLDDKLNFDGNNQMNGSLDMNNNKLVNLSAGTDDNNAVTKSQLDSHTIAVADKANKSYVDSENGKQYIAIADKASKSYVDSENAKQGIAIADKVSKS